MSPDDLFAHSDRTEPVHDSDLVAAMRLNLVDGVGPRLWQELCTAFGSPAAVLARSAEELRQVRGIGPKVASAILQAPSVADVHNELAHCRQLGVSVLHRQARDYPRRLAEIHDPPGVLYVRGDLTPSDELAVAIVGSRQCTSYGVQQAERIAAGLARAGVTVISGLARGIDAAAHRGALQGGGRTLAVCATGLATVYPPEHAPLADQIAQQGALLCESPLRQAPLPGLFPQRNRIISGLSVAVVVIEARRGSGALHTARHASEQNRDLFVLPGRVDSEASAGCLDLLRDGAQLIRGVDDILEELGPLTRPVATPAGQVVHQPVELTLNDLEKAVLGLVQAEATPIDDVLRGAGLEPSRVLSTLTLLEMRRLVKRLPGNHVVRAN